MSRVEDTLAWMCQWVGYTEGPKANEQPFDDIAGHAQDLAWCATFRVAAHKSTRVAIPNGGGSAFTPTNYAAYKRAGLLVDDPQPGDIGWIAYSSMLGNRMLGIGHELTILARDGNTVTTVEGNANQSGSRTGGQVATLRRNLTRDGRDTAWFVGFARPQWNGEQVTLINLPFKADHTGQMAAVPAVYPTGTGKKLWTPGAALVVDGDWGENTSRSLQHRLGVDVDGDFGSGSTKALQRYLIAKVGAPTRKQGGPDGDLGKFTIRALQSYLGTPVDGVLSKPSSVAVVRLQARLNAGTF